MKNPARALLIRHGKGDKSRLLPVGYVQASLHRQWQASAGEIAHAGVSSGVSGVSAASWDGFKNCWLLEKCKKLRDLSIVEAGQLSIAFPDIGK
ncbi:MAG: hypothetical protein WCK77_20375 [Verrucomicrobiota bacterium]